mgnify:CR=1 FL=1
MYLAAVDASGKETLSPEFEMATLPSLMVLAPTAAQSPVTSPVTFQWTPPSGWPQSPVSYTVQLYDASMSPNPWIYTAPVSVPTTSTTGTHVYNGPALDPAKTYRARIYGLMRAGTPTICPACDYISMDNATQAFSVRSSMTLRTPNGGDTWVQGFKGSVFWSAEQANSININLLKEGTLYRSLATNVPVKGFSGYDFQNLYPYPQAYHAWVSIPVDVAEGSDYTLEVVDATNSAIRDVSDSSFRVIPLYSPVMVQGRFIDRFTRAPLANISLGSYDSSGAYTYSPVNANGEFTLTSTIAGIAEGHAKSLFAAWPACYISQGAGVANFVDAIYSTLPKFDLIPGNMQKQVWGPLVNFGDIEFWPAVTLNISSDVTGSYSIEYPEEGTGAGSLLSANVNTSLANVIPLDYNVRVKIINSNGVSFYSPYIKLSLSHGCKPITLRFLGGQFTWETQ